MPPSWPVHQPDSTPFPAGTFCTGASNILASHPPAPEVTSLHRIRRASCDRCSPHLLSSLAPLPHGLRRRRNIRPVSQLLDFF
jgi:hypothetical protein